MELSISQEIQRTSDKIQGLTLLYSMVTFNQMKLWPFILLLSVITVVAQRAPDYNRWRINRWKELQNEAAYREYNSYENQVARAKARDGTRVEASESVAYQCRLESDHEYHWST